LISSIPGFALEVWLLAEQVGLKETIATSPREVSGGVPAAKNIEPENSTDDQRNASPSSHARFVVSLAVIGILSSSIG
jgi:hypothetical protein